MPSVLFIPSTSAMSAKCKHHKQVYKDSNFDVIMTKSTKIKKCKIPGISQVCSLLVSSSLLLYSTPSPRLNNKVDIMPYDTTFYLERTVINEL